MLSRRHFAQTVLGGFATIPFLTRFLPTASGFDREAVLAAVKVYPPFLMMNHNATCTRAVLMAYLERYDQTWQFVMASSFWAFSDARKLSADGEDHLREALRRSCADVCEEACRRGYWETFGFAGKTLNRTPFRRFRLVPP